MPCASYTDPRLAAVYDALNPWDLYYDFYIDLAGTASRTVLDMGCGTGRLSRALAERGHAVTGADPAAAMLDIARHRQGGDRVTWVDATAAALDLDTRFDLIIMTGHVFQVFLDDDEVAATLTNLGRHLAPGGRLAFETRNPAVAEWRDWIPEKTRERVAVPKVGMVDVHNDIRSAEGPYVTFETHFQFAPGDAAVGVTTLRFMNETDLAGFLAAAGFTDVILYGDWDFSLFSPGSPEIITIASKA